MHLLIPSLGNFTGQFLILPTVSQIDYSILFCEYTVCFILFLFLSVCKVCIIETLTLQSDQSTSLLEKEKLVSHRVDNPSKIENQRQIVLYRGIPERNVIIY